MTGTEGHTDAQLWKGGNFHWTMRQINYGIEMRHGIHEEKDHLDQYVKKEEVYNYRGETKLKWGSEGARQDMGPFLMS